MLSVANEPRFACVPPARIVPMLADEGVYLASESSFARVLRAEGQNAHRGHAKAPKAVRPPSTHIAKLASTTEEPSALVRRHTQLVADWGGYSQPGT